MDFARLFPSLDFFPLYSLSFSLLMSPAQSRLGDPRLLTAAALVATTAVSLSFLSLSSSSSRSFPFPNKFPFSSNSSTKDKDKGKEETREEEKRYEVKKEFYSNDKGEWTTKDETDDESDDDDDDEEEEGKKPCASFSTEIGKNPKLIS